MKEWFAGPVRDIYRSYEMWQEDDGSHLAASVSYYAAISLFPVLLILLSGFGFVLRFSGWGQNARQRLLDVIADQTSPALTRQLEAVLSNVQDSAVVGGPVGLITLLVASMAVFVHFDDAMDRIWNVPRTKRPGVIGVLRSVLFDRLRAFVMLLGIGVFIVLGFAATMFLTGVGRFAAEELPMGRWAWSLLTLAAAVLLNWLLFAIVYKFLPKVPVSWWEAARGALLASVMWELGRRLLAVAVIGSRFSVYGTVGAFIAIMLWIFYATTILFLGAEYIQVICERCNPKAESGSHSA